MSGIRRLIVNWQNAVSREFLPVAELIVDRMGPAERFEFGYLEGVRAALQQGFQPFLAFPQLDRRYSSATLFSFFRNRVLPTTRPDYQAYVAALGLDVTTSDVAEILGRSEGRRQTDRIEMVLVARRDPESGRYVTRFLLRGVRHVPLAEDAIATLRAGDVLGGTREPTNPKNARAWQLRVGDQVIGWVPDYLLGDLEALDSAGGLPTFFVEHMNPPPHPTYHRLLVRLEARWPEGFEPFSAAPFRRLRAEAQAPGEPPRPLP